MVLGNLWPLSTHASVATKSKTHAFENTLALHTISHHKPSLQFWARTFFLGQPWEKALDPGLGKILPEIAARFIGITRAHARVHAFDVLAPCNLNPGIRFVLQRNIFHGGSNNIFPVLFSLRCDDEGRAVVALTHRSLLQFLGRQRHGRITEEQILQRAMINKRSVESTGWTETCPKQTYLLVSYTWHTFPSSLLWF